MCQDSASESYQQTRLYYYLIYPQNDMKKLYSVKHGINFLIDSLTIYADKVIFIYGLRMLIMNSIHNRIDLNFYTKIQ